MGVAVHDNRKTGSGGIFDSLLHVFHINANYFTTRYQLAYNCEGLNVPKSR